MNTERKPRARLRTAAIVIGIVGTLTVLALLAVYLVGGPGLRRSLSSRLASAANLGRAVAGSGSVTSSSHGEFTNVVFLHHSTGNNLIEQGGVRERFAAAGYDFWDHGYNEQGLRDPAGRFTGYNYAIPEDNTDPDGLAGIFAQPVYGLPLNAFSGLVQHEVIAFKSCFPVNHIASDEQLETYKAHYLGMRDVIDRHPDRVFIVVTPPPLNPAETNAGAATRARAFANWLTTETFPSGHPNVFTFDLFGYLAEDDPASPDHNMLRRAYREGADSHPNRTANETIAPLFVDFIIDAVRRYRE